MTNGVVQVFGQNDETSVHEPIGHPAESVPMELFPTPTAGLPPGSSTYWKADCSRREDWAIVWLSCLNGHEAQVASRGLMGLPEQNATGISCKFVVMALIRTVAN